MDKTPLKRLWEIFRNKEGGNAKFLTIGADDRTSDGTSVSSITSFYSIPVDTLRKKPRRENTSDAKPTEILKGVVEAIEGKRAGLSREMELLFTEREKLDITTILEKSSKHQ